MGISVYGISDIDDVIKELGLDMRDYLNSLTIKNNPNIQDFFRNHAILRDKDDTCRTFLVIDSESNPQDNIVGYFSVTVTYRKINNSVSKNLKKKISSSVVKTNIFSSILITKLGRSDKYKGIVEGSVIMKCALDKCYEIYELTGLRHVCVDFYNNEFLEDFYLNKSGFIKYQDDPETNMNYCFYKFS